MKTLGFVLVAIILTLTFVNVTQTEVAFGQVPDEGGNLPGGSGIGTQALGDVLNSFPDPASKMWGLTFRNGSLWAVGNTTDTLYQMNPDTGVLLSSVVISPVPSFPAGLGYDSTTDHFVLSDAVASTIIKINPSTGAQVSSFASPGSGPVGVAYDSTRNGYWISDFNTNQIDLVNTSTGSVMKTCSVPSGASRINGAGYDPNNDVIMFHSRNSRETYLISGDDCSEINKFPVPMGGINNGQGAAIRPSDLTGYLTHFEQPTIFVVDLELTIPDTVLDAIAALETKLDTNLDTSVSTRSSQSSVDALEAKADVLEVKADALEVKLDSIAADLNSCEVEIGLDVDTAETRTGSHQFFALTSLHGAMVDPTNLEVWIGSDLITPVGGTPKTVITGVTRVEVGKSDLRRLRVQSLPLTVRATVPGGSSCAAIDTMNSIVSP